MNENTTSDNLDIIFFDLSKKWQMYNRRHKSADVGLCFQAFVQFFLTFSQLNYNENRLEQNLTLMIRSCQLNMRPPPVVVVEKDQVVLITQDNELVSDSGNVFNMGRELTTR